MSFPPDAQCQQSSVRVGRFRPFLLSLVPSSLDRVLLLETRTRKPQRFLNTRRQKITLESFTIVETLENVPGSRLQLICVFISDVANHKWAIPFWMDFRTAFESPLHQISNTKPPFSVSFFMLRCFFVHAGCGSLVCFLSEVSQILYMLQPPFSEVSNFLIR
jgi:hypothetical protein